MKTLWLAVLAVPLAAQPALDSVRQTSQALEELAERLSASVVQIQSEGITPDRRSTGSGVVISDAGHIVTNAHVVSGGSRWRVRLPALRSPRMTSIVPAAGRVLPARLLGTDLETDLAVLKVDATGLTPLPFGDSDQVRQGQLVVALGSPVGLENSMSMGVISAVARQLEPDAPVIYLQTDAPINPGNSGGPLVNIRGEIIGINTLILSQGGGSEGIGFAVPSNIVRTVAGQLREKGRMRRGEIGARAQTITPRLAAALGLPRESGVVLSDVEPDSPASRAELQVGDIVLALNGKPMENARQFHVNLYGQPLHSVVRIDVLRGRETLRKSVVVADREDDPERFSSLVDRNTNWVGELGVVAIALDPKSLRMLPGLRRNYGILVASAAQSGELSPGDVVYSVNNQPVSTMTEFRQMIAKLKGEGGAVLQVERQGRLRFVELGFE